MYSRDFTVENALYQIELQSILPHFTAVWSGAHVAWVGVTPPGEADSVLSSFGFPRLSATGNCHCLSLGLGIAPAS